MHVSPISQPLDTSKDEIGFIISTFFIKFHSHAIQVHSSSYGKSVLRMQRLHCLAYLAKTTSSAKSIY